MNTHSIYKRLWLFGLLLAMLGLWACDDSASLPADGDVDRETEAERETSQCTPGEKVCQGSQLIFRCNDDGQWEQYGFCTGLQTCQEGLCIGTADGDGSDDELSDSDADADYLCSPDSFRCRENVLEHCNPTGDWEFYRDCHSAGKYCTNGECVTPTDGDSEPDGDTLTCTPGERLCADADSVERCTIYGNAWEVWQTCSALQTCVAGECVVPPGEACLLTDGCADDNEYCLADEIDSDSGHCMPYCDLDGVSCPAGWSCEHSVCEPIENYCRTDPDCAMDEFCNIAPMQNDGTCQRYCDLPGENCPELYICDSDPQSPNYGRCVLQNPSCEPCDYDGQCATGQICVVSPGQTMGCCLPACQDDDDCAGNLVCNEDGLCGVAEPGNCGGTCPPGYVCDPLFDQCIIDCPPCGPDECCDAASAPNCYTCECVNPQVCGILLEPCCYGYSCSSIVYGVVGYCI